MISDNEIHLQERPALVEYPLEGLRRLALAMITHAIREARKVDNIGLEARAWLVSDGAAMAGACGLALTCNDFTAWIEGGAIIPRR